MRLSEYSLKYTFHHIASMGDEVARGGLHGGMADGRPPKVGGLREDGLTGSVKGGRPTRAASLAKAADGAGIVGAISKFLARTPPSEEGEGDGGRGDDDLQLHHHQPCRHKQQLVRLSYGGFSGD